MKKAFISFFMLIALQALSAQSYKIIDSEITILGTKNFATTKPYTIKRVYPLDTKSVFTKEQLGSYLENYKKELQSSRFFDELSVGYEALIQPSEEEAEQSADSEITEIIVKISLKDSKHFLAVPYFTSDIDSNGTIITPKLKAKDTNFLGSMNPLSLDAHIKIAKNDSIDYWTFSPGFDLSYDYPFRLGPFDVTWVNDYEIAYTFGDESPEWEAKSGFKFKLPFQKLSLVLEAYQYFFRDYDYTEYGDDTYFQEEFQFSTPILVTTLPNYSNVYYTPLFNFSWFWDTDYISKQNDDLSGPQIKPAHQLENSKILWANNFRDGYYLKVKNAWLYNLQRYELAPSIGMEVKGFKSFKLSDNSYFDMLGLGTDLYTFAYFDMPENRFYYGEKIGQRLRGIADKSYFGNSKPDYTTSAALVLNLDMPVNIIKTDFTNKILQKFNFNLQVSPFIDSAIYRDRLKSSQVETALCSGFEVLVFPKRWSSFIVRGSLGFDMKSAFAEKNLIKGLLHNKEIFIGLGLLY